MTTAGSGEQDLEPADTRRPLLAGCSRDATPASTLRGRRTPASPSAAAAAVSVAAKEAASATDSWHEHRERLATFVERPGSSRAAAAFQAVIVILILTSTFAAIVETVPEIGQTWSTAFFVLEATVTVLFSVELVLRFFACESATAFFTNGFNIVDFLAILPGFVLVSGHLSSADKSTANAMMSLRMVRLMWLVRILRLAKVARHSRLLSLCIAVVTKAWHSSIVIVLGLVFALTIVSSSLLYLVEYDRCQELGISCKGFESIPHACWFSISTLTTVGYGDVIPETRLGKAIAVFFAVTAVIVFALAGAMFSYDFAEYFHEERERRRVEIELSLGSGRDQEFRELQELARSARAASEELVARLAFAAAKRKELNAERQGDDFHDLHDSSQLTVAPMLRLLEERARIFSSEVQSCVFAAAAADCKTKNIADLQTYMSESVPQAADLGESELSDELPRLQADLRAGV